MPNMPVVLPKSDYNLCWSKCNETAGCVAWSYGVDGPGCETQPLCWLKASTEAWSTNPCRVAGNQALPGGIAERPVINGNCAYCTVYAEVAVKEPHRLFSFPRRSHFPGRLPGSELVERRGSKRRVLSVLVKVPRARSVIACSTRPLPDDALKFDLTVVKDFGMNVIRLHQKVNPTAVVPSCRHGWRRRAAGQPPTQPQTAAAQAHI